MTALRRFARPDVLDEIPLASHAWIEASAGTGKTFTLEHLIVDLIVRAGARLEEIVVLTFTEKATLEMRERVRATLVALVHAGPDDPRVDPPAGDNAWTLDAPALERLREAVEGFEAASIHTIHGYCQRVLQEHAFRSRGLFEQDLADSRSHFRRAVRAVLREALRPEDPAYAVLSAALGQDSPSSLTTTLTRWASEPGVLMPPASLEAVHAVAVTCSAPARRQALVAAAQHEPTRTRAPLQEHLDALFVCAQQVLAAPDLMSAAGVVNAWSSRPQGASKTAGEWVFERATKNPALAHALAPFEALMEAIPHFPMLVVQTLLPRVLAKANESKRAASEMDFDDLLTRVRDALEGEGGGELADALRAQHRFGIIDEFQDTDATQWAIFRRLFFEGNEAPARRPLAQRRALYLIGDPKQAIYGFRGADVHTYLSARDALAPHTERVVLKQNFRSTAAMIDAYNAIFARGFFAGPIRYDTPVGCGDPTLSAQYGDGGAAAPLVLLRPTVAEGAAQLTADGVRDALADAIASEIEALLGDGPRALRVGRAGALRRLLPSDIYVLGRQGRDLEGVHDRLAARGIPCAYFKRHGLYGTREAEDLLMVLRAIADPSERSHRLKAWLTPFFGLALSELRGDEELHDDHPLVARLVRLRDRCEARDYAAFGRELLYESGLSRRELFVEESARRLTNYQHLVDVVLERAHGRRRTVDELVVDFQQLIEQQSGPQVSDDIERVATDGPAVQLLTMHKSKGLEAEVVFVLGGLGSSDRSGTDPRVRHAAGVRQAWMRPLSRQVAEDVAREQAEEDERLFYVALTRARSRLYLPYFGEDRHGQSAYALRGNPAYAPVQHALEQLVTASSSAESIELRAAPAASPAPAGAPLAPHGTPVDAVVPARRAALAEEPAALPAAPTPLPSALFADLRRRHSGPFATSYSRLTGSARRRWSESSPNEELKADIHDASGLVSGSASAAGSLSTGVKRALRDLPGGASTGLFLHEALERVDLRYIAGLGDASEALVAEPGGGELRVLLESCAARNGVDAAHVPAAAELIFRALRSPLPTRGGDGLPLVDATRLVREMSFQFPIPEASHPSLTRSLAAGVGGQPNTEPLGAAPFRVERGVVRGVVDVVFEHAGAVYFLDWKSDRVDGGEAALRAHVRTHYELQIKLYTLGVLRLLDVWDEDAYAQRFGGHLYAFLRPLGLGEEGVVFERPSFEDVQRWERELLSMSFGGAAAPAGRSA